MIELSFVTGGALRKVVVNGRKLSLITAELGFNPLTIDLDKLGTEQNKEKLDRLKLSDEDRKTIKEISKLGSEEDIAQDIIKDFQKTGWRLVKKKW